MNAAAPAAAAPEPPEPSEPPAAVFGGAHAGHVSFVIRLRVEPRRRADYERWLTRIMPVAATYPGHLGVSVIRPDAPGTPYTIVLRFERLEQLRRWMESADRRELIEQIRPLLAAGEDLDIRPGAAFWFTPAGAQPPRLWKQVLMTFAVIWPLTLIVPQLWQPAFTRWPWLGGWLAGNFVVALSIVLIVVCAVMPWLTRRLAGWLTR